MKIDELLITTYSDGHGLGVQVEAKADIETRWHLLALEPLSGLVGEVVRILINKNGVPEVSRS